MRRTHQVLLTTLLGASFGATAQAQSGPPDAQSIRPAVMLLVDTSGSMERVPDDGSNPSCDSCVPTCTGDTLIDRNNKTRWALTVEALTGTIQNYQCTSVDRSSYPSDAYDYGYYLPHIDFTPGMTQASDGILDSFATRVKFGLMTFDGVGTTLGGDTLIGFSRWFSDAGFMSAANGAPGMYSYGDVGRLAFPGCLTDYGINAGARGEGTFAGALVSIPRLDGVDDALAVNAQIQNSLTQVRPFGGTPIAGMLDDLRYYLQHNTNVIPSNGSTTVGDPLYQCRKRTAILITDGAPDAMFRDPRFNCGIEEPASPGGPRVPSPAVCTASNSNWRLGDDLVMYPQTGCSCPYKKPEDIAVELTGGTTTQPTGGAHLLTNLIVVAYNVHDPLALEGLEKIGAKAVGDWPPDITGYRHVVQADGAGELRQKLDELLNASQPGVTSRSVPLSVTVGDPAASGSTKRFDITAGFQIGRNTNEAWQGLLYRGRSICQGTSITEEPFKTADGDVFHEVLTEQTAANQRVLLTATPDTFGPVDGTIVNVGYRPTQIQPGDQYYDSTRLTGLVPFNVRRPSTGDLNTLELAAIETVITVAPSQRLVTQISDNPLNVNSPNFVNSSVLNPRYFGDATRDGTPSTDADRAAIVDFTLGRGRPNALADIYHSQPIVMLPVNRANEARFSTVDARYTNWLHSMVATTTGGQYDAGGRPGVVFVGTNDGILHAFNLDNWSNRGSTIGGGRELWGFVPPALFGKMASMIDAHQTGFDGSPEVKDVVLQRRDGQEPIFRSILVSAVRGAPAYVALDVTYPEAPVFLWQFSAPDVGNTVGNVALTQVKVNWPGSPNQVRGVAILPGGEGSECLVPGPRALQANWNLAEFPRATTTPRSVRCWNRRGRALYVVDVATGAILQEFGPGHFPSPLTGAVVVDSPGLSTSTAAYVFDHDGVLWRLSMLSADPRNWRVAPVFDMFRNLPAISIPDYTRGRRPLFAPTLLRDKTGNLVIVAGTGDPDDVRDSAQHRVVSLTEKRGPLVDGEISAEMVLNWSLDLKANESITGPMTLFQDAVYFASFEVLPGNLCGLGTSYLWGVHAYESVDPQASESARLPKPQLAPSQGGINDPYVDKEEYSDNGLVIGATVKQQPICQSSTRSYNAATQQSVPTQAAGGGAYQLTAVMAGGSSGGHARTGNTGRGAVLETEGRTLRVVQNTKVTSWASMFE